MPRGKFASGFLGRRYCSNLTREDDCTKSLDLGSTHRRGAGLELQLINGLDPVRGDLGQFIARQPGSSKYARPGGPALHIGSDQEGGIVER